MFLIVYFLSGCGGKSGDLLSRERSAPELRFDQVYALW